jgi:hypothetical protein
VRRWVTVATTASLLAFGPSAALADTWRAPDARHDVSSFEVTFDSEMHCHIDRQPAPEDEKRDVTRLAVDHTTDALRVVVGLGAVPRHDPRTGYELGIRTPEGDYSIEAGRKREGILYTHLTRVRTVPGSQDDGCPRSPEHTDAPCADLLGRTHDGSDRLTFVVPRACLGDPRWVRVGFRASGAVANGEESVFTMFVDAWRPRGGGGLGQLVPYGPKVPVG